MTFRTVLAACLCLVSLFATSPAHAADKKPNVIYIMADDLGWTDTGCYGSKYYETPNIDKLAAGGMRFTNGYSCAPNCAPTRAALMSGQYEPRTGIYTVGSIDRFDWTSRPMKPVDNIQKLPLEKITVANAMKNAGYATAMYGKWHLGGGEEYHPSARGFDEAIESNGRHFDFKTDPETPYAKGTYLADFLTDHTIDFINRKKDVPFFVYLPHFGVHAPYQAKADLIEKFKKKQGVGGHNDPTYAAMIYSVDESVGRIVAEIEKLGLTSNTLIVFTSDNGGIGGYSRAGIEAGKEITDNTPLKGGKGMLYEGGVRVPYIFRWPGKIAEGTVNDQPICSIDLYPSLLELAGSTPAKDYTLDGVSYIPTLMTGKPLDREAIYWHFPGYLGAKANNWRTKPGGAIRMGDFKLLEFFEDGALELYNLKTDVGQENNLAKTDPERTKMMHEKLVAWRQATGAKMPTPITEADKQAAKKKGKKNRKNEDGDE